MKNIQREDVLFATLGTISFSLVAALCAAGRWYLAQWYLGHCGQSVACTAADAATDYWWVALVGLALAVARPINRSYQARLQARKPDPT